ncbi:MAG: alanine--glyoxylate aminotransferase family protein [Ignavibacteriales bacterium]|nr:alanine--glyoxylate aminotransferase family protein [Ignavibacteriales bacterium]
MKNRKLLMIPGPIEFTPDVLRAMGMPTTSHVAPNFIEVFGQVLEDLRKVFLAPSGQPFVVPGSGTLAMDMAAANLVEPGDRALVVNTGYFSDRFAKILERYGAITTHVHARAIGDAPPLSEVESALQSIKPKLMTITHVDTSTAVATNVKDLAALGRKHGALVVVDGVCATAGEEMRQDEWGVDLALTASQKALGVPPGLAVVVAGPRAMETYKKRTKPVGNFYADWTEWLPIMKAYEGRKPSYFATPAVNLMWALHVSLKGILAEGMEVRFARHKKLSDAFKAAMSALALKQLPVRPENYATTLSGVYYPQGVDKSFLKFVDEAGVIVAGGLHPAIREQYFRVGHMGAVAGSDVIATVAAIESGLSRAGYKFEKGVGIVAAQGHLL